MEALFTLLLFLPFVLSLGHVSARNSSGCPAHYNNETHWCAENSSGSHLCEIVDGMYYSLCGTDRCYNYFQYEYGLSPPTTLPSLIFVQLQWHHAFRAEEEHLSLLPLRLCTGQRLLIPIHPGCRFWVGGNPSTYCPFEDDDPDACAYDSNTVFYSNSLAVTTPGGQRIFIKEDGTLAFTVAHSASEPDAAYDGENVAYSHAGYFGPGGQHWAACRPRGSSGRRRIVADLPGVDLDTEDCEGVFLYVSDLEKGTVGAWEYT